MARDTSPEPIASLLVIGINNGGSISIALAVAAALWRALKQAIAAADKTSLLVQIAALKKAVGTTSQREFWGWVWSRDRAAECGHGDNKECV
jgi:hypothetical protein